MRYSEVVLLEKQYYQDSLGDLDRNVLEAISEDYNELMKDLPANEDGELLGSFNVVITFVPNNFDSN